jgi:translation initiation factor 3 subunit E
MSDLSTSELAIATKYDLVQKMIPFFDRHLVYPILESLGDIYDEKTITKLTFELFKETNMTNFLETQWKALGGGGLPAEIVARKQENEKEFARLSEETKKVLDVLSQQEVQDHLKQDKNLNQEYLLKNHSITEADVDKLYEFGQFQYNSGDYVMASDLLSNFRALSTNSEKVLNATWGKLACDIIRTEWDSALKELGKLREVIDSRSFAEPLTQLHHRTWIIHWSLFPFYNAENGLESLLDLFFSSSYMSTIQAASPWILRYLVAAVVSSESSTKNNLSNPNFQKRLKDLIRVVGQEQYEYNDPLTDFIKALYIDFDFEEANAKLNESLVILKTDFFLSNISDIFVKNARHLISEVYCRVHQKIDLNDFSKSLNLSREEGEKWIANLIKETKMDAKIDESEGTVILNHPQNSVYQQVIEKTKGLSFKANQILATALQKQDNVQ